MVTVKFLHSLLILLNISYRYHYGDPSQPMCLFNVFRVLKNKNELAHGAKMFSVSCEESQNRSPIEMVDKHMEERSKELKKACINFPNKLKGFVYLLLN